MTNRIAIFLAIALIGLIVVDVYLYDNEHLVFLGKKLADLIEWLAVWR